MSRVRIRRLGVTPYRIPFRRPFATAAGLHREREGLIVCIDSESGLRGVGEVAPHPARVALQLPRAESALRRAAECIAGSRVDGEELLRLVSDATARIGVETAWLDLQARAAGVPLGELLGAVQRREIPVNATIGAVSPEATAGAARAAVAAGFRCLKLKVGAGDPSYDEARVAAVRAAVGESIAIRLDANAAWNVEQAIVVLRRLERHRIEYVEQPVADISALATVRAAVEVPIAADESVVDVPSVECLAEAGAADLVVIKPALHGLSAACEIAACVRGHGLGTVVTSTLETSIGLAAAMHLASVLPDPLPACGLATIDLLGGDTVCRSLRAEGGAISVPAGPGLGVDVALEAAGVGCLPG